MVFTVQCGDGQVITDPESGRELGILRREQLQVRVFDVQPLFARAHTFVRTDDFHGLLQIPFVDHVVTVNVGDAVIAVADDASTSWAGTGTGEPDPLCPNEAAPHPDGVAVPDCSGGRRSHRLHRRGLPLVSDDRRPAPW